MSLLDAVNYDSFDLSRPVFDKQTLRVTLADVFEETDVATGRVRLVVQHTLAHDAVATNGKTYNAGFPFTTNINHMVEQNGTPLTDGQKTANRINGELTKKLICAALKVPMDTTGLNAKLTEMGGWSALNGRDVMVVVSARADRNDASKSYQDAKSYAQVPA